MFATMENEKVCVTKEFIFEMAHALFNYDGPCKNIHGHTYRLQVSLIGCVNQNENHAKNGMVVDFGDLKRVVNEEVIAKYDHSLVLNGSISASLRASAYAITEKIHFVPFQPTCENLLLHFKNLIINKLSVNGNQLQELRLFETPTSWATWRYADQQ